MKTGKKKTWLSRTLKSFVFFLSIAAVMSVFPAGKLLTVQAASKAKLNYSRRTLCVKSTLKLKVTGKSKKAVWKSDDPSVAAVSAAGKVIAQRIGNTVITATVGKKSYKCSIAVRDHNYESAPDAAVCTRCGAKKSGSLVPLTKLDRYQYFRRYMTDSQMQQAYKEAVKVTEPLKSLTLEDQLVGVASTLRKRFDSGMKYSMSAAHYNDPYGYLVLGVASCAGCARTTGFCLNVLGITYEHVNENQYSHQWARVKVGSEYWICDAYGLYCGPEPAVRKHPYL